MKRWVMANSAIVAEEFKRNERSLGRVAFPTQTSLLSLCRCIVPYIFFAYFAPFLKEAKGAKAVAEQKKEGGGGRGGG